MIDSAMPLVKAFLTAFAIAFIALSSLSFFFAIYGYRISVLQCGIVYGAPLNTAGFAFIALDRVRALTKHPAFSVANPNRVRALIGSFAQVNHTQFNRPDGAGFDFVADFVLALDPKNPQVAARLMGAFRSWRALEARRRGHAETALRRIAATPALSRDVHDIVARTLADS